MRSRIIPYSEHLIESGADINTIMALLVETPERMEKLRKKYMVDEVEHYINSGKRYASYAQMPPDIQKLTKNGVPESVFVVVLRGDPTSVVGDSGEIKKCGIYADWLLNQYVKTTGVAKTRFTEDLYKAVEALKVYHAKKHLAPVDKRNIWNIKSIIDLEDVAESLEDQQTRGEKKKAVERGAEEADVLLSNASYMLVVPKTYEASRYYGKETRWCTAADSSYGQHYFKQYFNQGPLYVVIFAATEDGEAKKFQFHFESGQFMNADDEGIDPVSFFKERKDIAQAIIDHRFAHNLPVEEYYSILDPSKLFEAFLNKFAEVKDKSNYGSSDALRFLRYRVPMSVIVDKFISGEFLPEMYTPVSSGPIFVVFDFEKKRIGYSAADMEAFEDFFPDTRRNNSRAIFKSVVNGDYDIYDSGCSVRDCIDSIDTENTEALEQLIGNMEEYDHDLREALENNDDVAELVTQSMDRAYEQAMHDERHKQVLSALSDVLGKETWTTDLTFWRHVDTYAKHLKELEAFLLQENSEPATLSDIITCEEQYAIETNAIELDPDRWSTSADDDAFNEILSEKIAEMMVDRKKKAEKEGLRREPMLPGMESKSRAIINNLHG